MPRKAIDLPYGVDYLSILDEDGMDSEQGLVKLIFDAESGRTLGVGIVGEGAEIMISEGALAVEMGALAEDLALTIHPYPTVSETLSGAAADFLGRATDILSKRR